MKSLKTKVIMSAFVLLFALVATIGSTYAWFTISDTVTVQAIDLTVTTEESLLIRVWDGEVEGDATVQSWTADDFTNSVTDADIIASTEYSSFASYLLTPVTAAHTPLQTGAGVEGTDYTLIDSDNLSTISIASPVDRELSAASANQVSTSSGYIEVKFWLMSQASAATVNLSTLTTSTSTGASQALYVGTKAETDTIEKIYPVESDWGFVFASNDLGFITEDGNHDNNDGTTYWNSVPEGQNTGTGDFGKLELQSQESSAGGTGAGDVIINLAADTPEILTVRIWLEGWDADATNAIMSETFTLTLEFSIFTVV